jgi:aldose 1-epimerase
MTVASPLLPNPDRFAGMVGGRPVGLFPLTTPGGLRAAVCNHGARLLALCVPGRNGRSHDVVLGYDSLGQMLDGMASMGAVVGRFANRIGAARFTLDGEDWTLPANDGANCLHGGPAGSRHQVFEVIDHTPDQVRLAWTFRQTDDGFPGDAALSVRYRLRDPGVLEIDWQAQALDRATVLNITAHPFFNLEGPASAQVRDHRVTIDAARYLPVDARRVPTGEMAEVAGTAFDLRAGSTVGEALARLPAGTGFDHCYLTGAHEGGPLRRAARVEAPGSGIAMEVWSDAPGLQFFTSSAFDGSLPRHAGKGGRTYLREAGLCLEPQVLPDAPNHPHFPSATLRPGAPRSGRIEYRFSVMP